MKPSKPKRLPIPKLIALLGVMLAANQAQAALGISLTSTPLGGGIFKYQYSIANSGPEDLALVTITDAGVGDPLIGSTLQTPAGFLSSYDPGLGFVDFISDTSVFGAGTTLSGFSFQSGLSAISHFLTFEALSVNGTLLGGNVELVANPVPEPATFWVAGLGLVALALVQRQRSTAKTIVS